MPRPTSGLVLCLAKAGWLLGVLRIRAILIGIASAALASGLVFALVAMVARLSRSEMISGLSISLAVLGGLFVGGLVAGRLSTVNPRFHGSVTGLGFAGLTLLVSIQGGSPAPLGSVLLLALLAIVTGGLGGVFGGRGR